MVKSSIQESLDEAFAQRLAIIEDPLVPHCRFAENRMSRRDQHALRHGQRRPSSEVRNRIKQRKPLPDTYHHSYRHEHTTESEERGIPCASMTSQSRLGDKVYTTNDGEQQLCNDGSLLNNSVGPCMESLSTPPTCSQTGDSILARRHPSTTSGKRRGDVIDVIASRSKHPKWREGSSHNFVQNHKRKQPDSSKIVTHSKRIRNIECRSSDVIVETKNGLKRKHECEGEDHYERKHQHRQFWSRQSETKEIEDKTDEIHILVDSMTELLSSLREPWSHSH